MRVVQQPCVDLFGKRAIVKVIFYKLTPSAELSVNSLAFVQAIFFCNAEGGSAQG